MPTVIASTLLRQSARTVEGNSREGRLGRDWARRLGRARGGASLALTLAPKSSNGPQASLYRRRPDGAPFIPSQVAFPDGNAVRDVAIAEKAALAVATFASAPAEAEEAAVLADCSLAPNAALWAVAAVTACVVSSPCATTALALVYVAPVA